MKIIDSNTVDKLSDLEKDLQEIERGESSVDDRSGMAAARRAVITAIRGVFKSNYDFAASLDAYRRHFKAKHTWTAVLERIASVQGCSARTLYLLLENYDAAQQLPLSFLDVMREEGIDPALGENRKLVKSLARAAKPASPSEAKASVTAALSNLLTMKPAVRSTPSELDDFANRIVRMFEARYRSYQAADRDDQIRFVLERVVNCLRADIRELRIYNRPDHVTKPVQGVR